MTRRLIVGWLTLNVVIGFGVLFAPGDRSTLRVPADIDDWIR